MASLARREAEVAAVKNEDDEENETKRLRNEMDAKRNMDKASKYECKTTLENFYNKFTKLHNQSLKQDYEQIYKQLTNELTLLEKELPTPTTKTSKLYILNYKILEHIYKINKIF